MTERKMVKVRLWTRAYRWKENYPIESMRGMVAVTFASSSIDKKLHDDEAHIEWLEPAPRRYGEYSVPEA